MKRHYFTLGLTVQFLCMGFIAAAQKTISEGTLSYSIGMASSGVESNNALTGASITVNLKGSLSRTDMTSSLGNEKTIYDARAGNAVILKEYSGQKLMITLTKENWAVKNKNSQGIQFANTTETKLILGYQCVKATTTLNDGSTLSVFYTKDLVLLNKEYDPTFKNLAGLPMQYEVAKGNNKFLYTITKIDLNTIPAARFEIPKTGYRVISYDENQQGKKE